MYVGRAKVFCGSALLRSPKWALYLVKLFPRRDTEISGGGGDGEGGGGDGEGGGGDGGGGEGDGGGRRDRDRLSPA